MAVESPSRPKRLTREEAKAQTRALLLDAADKMFRRLGYEAAKLEDIAEEAGFTKGAMYFHFASKDALFLELLDTALRQQIAELNALTALAAIGADAFEAGVEQFLDRLDAGDDPAPLALEVQLASRRNPEAMQHFAEIFAPHQQAVSGFLRDYFKITGRTPAVPIEVLPGTIVAISEGIALMRQANGDDAVATTAQVIRILIGDIR